MTPGRRTNRRAVIRFVKVLATAREPISTKQAADAADVNYFTAKLWMQFIVAGGLVEFAGFGESKSGPKPALYRWAPK